MGRSKSKPLRRKESHEILGVFGVIQEAILEEEKRKGSNGRPARVVAQGAPSFELVDSDDEIPVKGSNKRGKKLSANAKQKKNPSKKKRTVAFADEPTTLQPAEVRIVYPDMSTTEGEPRPEIYIFNGDPSFVFEEEDTSYSCLRVIPLECASVRVSNDDDKTKSALCSFPVVTSLGAQDLIQFVHPTSSMSARLAVGNCIQEKLLKMYLVQSNDDNSYEIHIFYHASRLLPLCQPEQLPIQRVVTAKKYRLQTLFHTALAALYPGTLLEETAPNAKKGTGPKPVVSAKQVYALTDNVQLKRTLQLSNTEKEPMDIPGLVPKLRPYQEAAVRWMVERETKDTPCDEWRLAWIYCDPDGIKPLLDNIETMPYLLVCPFTGWLAASMDDARAMMLGSESSSDAVKGGILAEQMGLGKTVEVIACILGNPKPVSTKIVSPPSSRRKLDLSDEKSNGESTGNINPPSSAIIVGHTDEDSEGESIVSPNSSLARSRTNIVTPEKSNVYWLDSTDDVLGSCLCGNVIRVEDCRRKLVVVCPACNEPMHSECAAFHSDEEARLESSPILFRQECTHRDGKAYLLSSYKRCPCCVAERRDLVDSRATLIVTPPAILDQWIREIARHTKRDGNESLKVAVYDGVDRICKSYGPKKDGVVDQMKQLQASILADNDVVLVTFDTLHRSLGHSDENKFVRGDKSDGLANLRKRKRYRVVPSPLGLIKWWRVCLDEAQRVETPTAGSAKMALKLCTNYRWCVSGTPVGRGKIQDLYGLLLFLKMYPFSNLSFFQKCFDSTYMGLNDRIALLLSNVFWRSTKDFSEVRDQMDVPDQVEKKIFLEFSSIEKHFYERQRERTLLTMGDVSDREKSGKQRKKSQINLLSDQLHKLRAACCHPQVGSSGIGKPTKRKNGSQKHSEGTGLESRVMSMEQILDRFIEDARQKCEESQRLSIMHANAMASISRLKLEAKERGVPVEESDLELLSLSCKQYNESLETSERNARATKVVGEIVLEGSTGFVTPLSKVRDGASSASWRIYSTKHESVSCVFRFEGPARRIKHIKLKQILVVPDNLQSQVSKDFQWFVLSPNKVTIQVSSASLGGEFIDVTEVSFPEMCSIEIGSDEFRPYKSKVWRLVVRSFHETPQYTAWKSSIANACNGGVAGFVGLDAQLFEAEIASDSLQKLHCLHNSCISHESLLNILSISRESDATSINDIRQKISAMRREASKIEDVYMEPARSVHMVWKSKLKEDTSARESKEAELFVLRQKASNHRLVNSDVWSDRWWDDFLSACLLYSSENEMDDIANKLLSELDGVIRRSNDVVSSNRAFLFPEFLDLRVFRTHLTRRVDSIREGFGGAGKRRSRPSLNSSESVSNEKDHQMRFKCPVGGHRLCISAITALSDTPSDKEISENSVCHICKADWNQKGPKCNHCKTGEELQDLEPDRVTYKVLSTLEALMRSGSGQQVLKRTGLRDSIEARSRAFFEVLEAEKRERLTASRLWRIHLDLLNDLDELNQCKTGMRLTYEDEDLTLLNEDQLNGVIVPFDIHTRYNEHSAKQAMALGDLRRATDTLRYLKNQTASESSNNSKDECIVCLSIFEGERAVLKCGHSFHFSPCLEKLTKNSGWISCPLRCRVRTDLAHVMIASSKRNDDGTKARRVISGSWGTKVGQLLSDVLEVIEKGEKCIIFSQWEDMLDIVEEAFKTNNINFSRATSMRRIGECTRLLRSDDCDALLLNIKNGAEGLTLLEATHVFMLEAILNYGLDSQAINRVHRIGQSKTTFVHRYLMKGTIEEKIDALRMNHQEEELEDSLNTGYKNGFKAGGIDGDLSSGELIRLLE